MGRRRLSSRAPLCALGVGGDGGEDQVDDVAFERAAALSLGLALVDALERLFARNTIDRSNAS